MPYGRRHVPWLSQQQLAIAVREWASGRCAPVANVRSEFEPFAFQPEQLSAWPSPVRLALTPICPTLSTGGSWSHAGLPKGHGFSNRTLAPARKLVIYLD